MKLQGFDPLIIGILAATHKDRLVFWPCLPDGTDMVCQGEKVNVLDHVTLELPSERIHITAYGADGKATHEARAWRMTPLECAGADLWFILLARTEVLAQQAAAVQRLVQMPTSDRERRLQEFSNYFNSMKSLTIDVPEATGAGDFVRCVASIGGDETLNETQIPSFYPPPSPTEDVSPAPGGSPLG
ncbi:hypothetical protein HQ576_08495, partial [bacterium]|nr:hypothetical protein [bacterium]